MGEPIETSQLTCWYALRDLKRTNAKLPAFKMLEALDVEVFTPKKWRLVSHCGKKERVQVPFMPDLLFAHATAERLDPIVDKIPTLQYRWRRDVYRQPITVREVDMERFIRAVNATDTPTFYLPNEITPQMFGKQIRIVGGPLNGCEGHLLTTRGSKVKRIMVELPDFFAVAVEVNPEYIQLL